MGVYNLKMAQGFTPLYINNYKIILLPAGRKELSSVLKLIVINIALFAGE